MTFPGISSLSSVQGISQLPGSPGMIPKAEPGAFHKVLNTAIQAVESQSQTASESIERFLSGEGEDLHKTILAAQRAELSFELFQQVRNKAVQAYQEIMRMQL